MAMQFTQKRPLDRHSRRVRILRVLLPLFGVSLLAMTYLVPEKDEDAIRAQLSEEDKTVKAASSQAENLELSGIREDGGTYSLKSKDINSDSVLNNELQGAEVDFTFADDEDNYRITSDTGKVDVAEELYTFEGNVEITTGDGYQINTEALDANLKTNEAKSDLPTQVRSEDMAIDSGGFTLKGEEGARVLEFKDGVEAVFQAKEKEE